jgi:hypothetical protein
MEPFVIKYDFPAVTVIVFVSAMVSIFPSAGEVTLPVLVVTASSTNAVAPVAVYEAVEPGLIV